MNKFRHRIPNFIDMGECFQEIEFNTTQELLDLEIVQRYSRDLNFLHFAIHKNRLMEICDGGFKWWVIGYIETSEAVNLPQWDHGYYHAELADGSIVDLSGNEVFSLCGDVLTLRDGSIAKNVRDRI